MDDVLFKQLFKDFSLPNKKYYLSQLFQRNEFSTRKISLSFKDESVPRVVLRIPNDTKKEKEVFEQVDSIRKKLFVSKVHVPERQIYIKPYFFVAEQWIPGQKLFLERKNFSKEIACFLSEIHKATICNDIVFTLAHQLQIFVVFFISIICYKNSRKIYLHILLSPF